MTNPPLQRGLMKKSLKNCERLLTQHYLLLKVYRIIVLTLL